VRGEITGYEDLPKLIDSLIRALEKAAENPGDLSPEVVTALANSLSRAAEVQFKREALNSQRFEQN
jgi:hypothetical protein